MDQRIDMTIAPQAYSAKLELEKYLGQCGLPKELLGFMKVRASQMNGCAFCIDMHWKEQRALGVSEQRLYGLDAWRESPYYTPAERAALAWTEALTDLRGDRGSDAVYDELRKHFDAKQIADLTYAIVAINGWNRLCIGFRTRAGNYKVGSH